MAFIDGGGQPVPEGAWGGDFDPKPSARCNDCGTPIPFGKFCPQHLQAAREKNEQVMAKKQAMSAEKEGHRLPFFVQHDSPDASAPLIKSVPDGPPMAPREVDMDQLTAVEQARAAAIVTPGVHIPPASDHLAPFSGTPTDRHGGGIGVGDRAEDDIAPSDNAEAMVNEGIMWICQVRAMIEDGTVPEARKREVLRVAAELVYAIADARP